MKKPDIAQPIPVNQMKQKSDSKSESEGLVSLVSLACLVSLVYLVYVRSKEGFPQTDEVDSKMKSEDMAYLIHLVYFV